ncbi:MAG: class I SAM-dependent methyltransferase [Clostridia bacterium]|nr:class I SAM-dependent methyltransferase [Clostridia bacterium]
MHYIGLMSEISDASSQNQIEVDAYVRIAQKYSGKILELGSGSGHISLKLADEGYDVTCLEIHRDMIHIHKERLTEKTAEKTTIVLGDMCSFDLNEKFDLIIAPNNVTSFMLNGGEFMDMLQSVKKHLTDLGVFVIEALQPNINGLKAIHGIEQISYFESMKDHNPIEERVTSFYNFDTGIETQKKIITEFKNGKIKRRVEYIKEHKLWFYEDMVALIEAAGLKVILKSGQLNETVPIDENSSHMVFYIKK